MKKIFNWLTVDVFDSIGKTIDKLFTSDDERLKARNEIFRVLAEKGLELDRMKTDIIMSETKGNFLQRSWRPILMLSFGFIVLYSKFLAPAFGLPNTTLEPDFWDLLNIGIGGYVIGRSAEKITNSLSDKITLKK